MLFNLFMRNFNVNSDVGLQDRWNKGPRCRLDLLNYTIKFF